MKARTVVLLAAIALAIATFAIANPYGAPTGSSVRGFDAATYQLGVDGGFAAPFDAARFEPACTALSCVDGGVSVTGGLSVTGNPTFGTSGDVTATFNGASATDTIVHSATTGGFTFSDDISCGALSAAGPVSSEKYFEPSIPQGLRAHNEVGGHSTGATWTNVGASTLPVGTQLAGWIVYDGRMWIVGGGITGGAETRHVYSSRDGVTWSEMGTDALPEALYENAVYVFDGKMYAVGGWGAGDLYTDHVWNSSDGITWSEVGTNAWGSIGRYGFGHVVFGGKMWAFGGYDGDYRNEIYSSTDGATWTDEGDLPTALFSTCALVYENNIYLISGQTAVDALSQKIYKSANGTDWSEVGTNSYPTTSRFHSCTVYDGKMWASGGSLLDGTAQKTVYYSTDGASWTEAGTNAITAGLAGHGMLVFDGRMWLIGGYIAAHQRTVFYSDRSITGPLAVAGAVSTTGALTVTSSPIYLTAGQKLCLDGTDCHESIFRQADNAIQFYYGGSNSAFSCASNSCTSSFLTASTGLQSNGTSNLVGSATNIGDAPTDALTIYSATMVLGNGAAGVDYCISANGETADPTGGICWDEDLGQWAIHNGETLLFWSAAAGAAGFYTAFSPYGQQSVYYSNTGVDVNGPYTQFIRYRGTGFGSGAAVQDGDSLGWIVFNGGDTGSSIDQAAIIAAYVDGTPSSGTDMPGRVVISTTPNSSATPREIFRASAAGDLHAVSGGTYNACSVATADGDFCAEDALQAVGTLDVGGAATLASTLAVTGGAATITGDVIRTDAKGATTKIVHATQSLTFAADPGDATKVTSGLIPAAATLKGISTRVVTAGTNCSSIDIGDGTDPDRFGNDQEITDTATTSNADATADPTGWLTTAREVTVTSNTANCFSLVIAVTAHYETISAATAD